MKHYTYIDSLFRIVFTFFYHLTLFLGFFLLLLPKILQPFANLPTKTLCTNRCVEFNILYTTCHGVSVFFFLLGTERTLPTNRNHVQPIRQPVENNPDRRVLCARFLFPERARFG